jgi:hypothetical protein
VGGVDRLLAGRGFEELALEPLLLYSNPNRSRAGAWSIESINLSEVERPSLEKEQTIWACKFPRDTLALPLFLAFVFCFVCCGRCIHAQPTSLIKSIKKNSGWWHRFTYKLI